MRSYSVHWFRLKIAPAAFGVALILSMLLPGSIAVAQSNDLAGDYTVTFVSTQIPTDIANGSMVIGRWRVSFADDGAYQAERLDLGLLVSGRYEVAGDQVTITDESGLLSCSNAAAATGDQGDVSTATYTFELDAGNLRFSPVDEGCVLRRLLLTTSDFTIFVPCTTEPFVFGTTNGDSATPIANDGSIFDEIAAQTTPEGRERDPSTPTKSVETKIDQLLAQLTACWATGDPSRFLPLLSSDFQSQFLSGTEQENLDTIASLQAAMQIPIVWERAGDVTTTDDNHAEAVVRTTAADQEEFVRYLFVLEDGEWRWDGTAAG